MPLLLDDNLAVLVLDSPMLLVVSQHGLSILLQVGLDIAEGRLQVVELEAVLQHLLGAVELCLSR